MLEAFPIRIRDAFSVEQHFCREAHEIRTLAKGFLEQQDASRYEDVLYLPEELFPVRHMVQACLGKDDVEEVLGKSGEVFAEEGCVADVAVPADEEARKASAW